MYTIRGDIKWGALLLAVFAWLNFGALCWYMLLSEQRTFVAFWLAVIFFVVGFLATIAADHQAPK